MDVTERQALTRAVDKLNAMDKCGDPEELHAQAEWTICERKKYFNQHAPQGA